jgi:hypothetical protein
MTGRWHLTYTLPDGERVTADHADPIARVFERAYRGPELSDLAAIVRWAEANRQMIRECQEGRCDHHVR